MEKLNSKLEVIRLGHSFGPKEVLKDINFSLQKGEVVSIVGPSGGGKTTLLHLCSNLLERTEGRINNTFSSSAFAFQDARLLPWKNALDNIAFGLKAQGFNKKNRYEKARKIAFDFGLEAQDLVKFPKDLSGGMLQRAAFARAFIVKPELLYLDEPFSAMDIGLKQELQDIMIKEVTNQKLSVLFITHDLFEAVKLSNKILLLGKDSDEIGTIIKTTTIDKQINERSEDFTRQEMQKLLIDTEIRKTFELKMSIN